MTSTLVANDLSFAYQKNGPTIIENLNFKLQPQSFNLLVGPSGCGKSTFFKLLAGLYPQYGGQITNGQVLLNNQPVGPIVPFERSKHIGMLFQNPSRQFTMPTVAKQITFALENIHTNRSQIEPKLNEVLTKLDLLPFKDRSIFKLSGGEQQRLALATTLALDSQIILLDEPFANVDPLGRKQLLADLKNLQLTAKKTIFITDHDLSGYDGLVDNLYVFKDKQVLPLSLSNLQNINEPTLAYAPLKNGDLSWQDFRLNLNNTPLFSALDFTLPKGQIGLLSGPNGVGKSSFFKALTKQIAFSGRLNYQNKDSKQWRTKAWAKIIGLVFQDSDNQFIKLTAREELLLSQKYSLAKDYWTTAKIKQAVEHLNLASVLDQSCYQLSGGQKRKLQVLTMLIMAQPVLLLDEPLASLDQTSAQNLLSLVYEVCQNLNLAILMISHQRLGLNSYIAYELLIKNQHLTLRKGQSKHVKSS